MLKKIILARSYGFCMGVKRAITIAEDTARDARENVTILNEIVHNEAVVERFKDDGVNQALTLDEVNEGTLIISAHGVAPNVIKDAQAKGLSVVDATCPLVTRIYEIVKKAVSRGYHIVHFGDPNHDETKGIVGHAPDMITVVTDKEKLTEMPDWNERKLAMTIQTTSSMEEAQQAQEAAKEKWPHLTVFDTICDATSKRQSAIVDLASSVDMILVVGSSTSANSKRLASIADSLCGFGVLIGSAEEINESWFENGRKIRSVGVSAGASTPEFLVEAVIERLMELSNQTASVERQEKGRQSAARSAV